MAELTWEFALEAGLSRDNGLEILHRAAIELLIHPNRHCCDLLSQPRIREFGSSDILFCEVIHTLQS